MAEGTATPDAPLALAVSADLAARLGYSFDDPALLVTALCHRSWCVEHPEHLGRDHNERLEFLGDAVLGLAVADELFRRHPDLPEGRLTEARKAVVSSAGLAPVAAEMGLGAALWLGRGEEQSGGRHKPSLLENAFEAVLGAVYLDGGFEAAARFVGHHLGAVIDGAADDPGSDFKSRLQEQVVSLGHEPPRYVVTSTGPEHAKQFTAVVSVGAETTGRGSGRTKKQAEQASAREALAALGSPTAAELVEIEPAEIEPVEIETAVTEPAIEPAGTETPAADTGLVSADTGRETPHA